MVDLTADDLRLVLAELDRLSLQAPGAGSGAGGEYVLVPREPTDAMYDAGYNATRLDDGTPQFSKDGFCLGHAGKIYRAMLAAHPLNDIGIRELIEAAQEALDMADDHGGMGWYVAIDKLRAALALPGGSK